MSFWSMRVLETPLFQYRFIAVIGNEWDWYPHLLEWI